MPVKPHSGGRNHNLSRAVKQQKHVAEETTLLPVTTNRV